MSIYFHQIRVQKVTGVGYLPTAGTYRYPTRRIVNQIRGIMMKQANWILIILSALLFSCARVKDPRLTPLLFRSNCNQQNTYAYSKRDISPPLHEIALDTVLTARFSTPSLNIANAVGILDLLVAYVNRQKAFKQDPSIGNRLDLIELKQRIDQRINLSSLEISAVASEMDCEEERTSQIGTFLKKREDELESKLTVGAIVVGAVGTIVTTALIVSHSSGNFGDYAGIISGVLETSFGVGILLNKQKIDFYHQRNALKVIWEGHETSENFPPSVWYYLNYFNPQQPDNNSLRFQILEKWMNLGQISEVDSHKRRNLLDIYFGEGGRYTSEQLTNRANMYDQLESYINLMKQDLKNLSIQVENLNAQ